MQYFFDNCISYRYVNCLKALDVDAVALRETFSPSIEDPDFLRALQGREIAYVSCDLKQRRRKDEAAELKRIGCTAIYFAPFWGKLTFWEQASWLISKWRTIDGFVNGAERGTIAEIKQNGRAMLTPL